MEYKELCSGETYGSSGSFGFKILVGSNEGLPDLDLPEIWSASHEAASKITAAIMYEKKKQSPKTLTETDNNKLLLNAFKGAIFVEEIPNGYCNDWCCRHLPWFVVTTSVGRIKIGWRKRVIEIDWSDTRCARAKDIFPAEDTTKGEKYIHAWSLDDAERYIDEIINSSPVRQHERY